MDQGYKLILDKKNIELLQVDISFHIIECLQLNRQIMGNHSHPTF